MTLETDLPDPAQDARWLLERETFEIAADNRIDVVLDPRSWHSAIVATRRALRDESAEQERTRRLAKAAAKKPGRRSHGEPTHEEWRWGYIQDRGQILSQLPRDGLPVRVSPKTLDRALAILNAIFKAASARGFAVEAPNGRRRLRLVGHQAEVLLRISERLEDGWRTEQPSRSHEKRDVKTKSPTGQLRLYISTIVGSEVCLADVEDRPLETQLNTAFCRVYQVVLRYRQWRRKMDELDRQHREAQHTAAEKERLEQEEERRLQEERARRQTLVEEASSWQSAMLIRRYVAHVERVASEAARESPRRSEFARWRAWALGVADQMDPTIDRTG